MIVYSAKRYGGHTAMGDDETPIAAFLLRPKRPDLRGRSFPGRNA